MSANGRASCRIESSARSESRLASSCPEIGALSPNSDRKARKSSRSDRVGSSFSGPDPQYRLDGEDDDLAIADVAGVGSVLYC